LKEGVNQDITQQKGERKRNTRALKKILGQKERLKGGGTLPKTGPSRKLNVPAPTTHPAKGKSPLE